MTTLENDIKTLKKAIKAAHDKISKVGLKCDEGKYALQDEYNAKKVFSDKYGNEQLVKALIGKPTGFKLQNSKGNKYGNL